MIVHGSASCITFSSYVGDQFHALLVAAVVAVVVAVVVSAENGFQPGFHFSAENGHCQNNQRAVGRG